MVNGPRIIEHQTPYFSHTFTVNFAVFAPNQDGVRNRGGVYLKNLLPEIGDISSRLKTVSGISTEQ